MSESTIATKAAPNRLLALWSSVIGKKVVMALTGAVLILFVISHMAGNLKIFSGPVEINAYSRFLREVGWPELGYGQLLWIVRIVLLVCAILHITAATQLTRMNWQARPVGYESKKDVETTWGALTMRWGGVASCCLHCLSPAALHRWRCGVPAGPIRTLDGLSKCGCRIFRLAGRALLYPCHVRAVSASGSRDLEHAPNAGLGHGR